MIEQQLAVGVVAVLAAGAQEPRVYVILLVAVEAADSLVAVVGKVPSRVAALAQDVLVVADERPAGLGVVVEQPRLPLAPGVAVEAVTCKPLADA